MARIVDHTQFDPSRDVFVRKPFSSNGRHYVSGNRFDWRRTCVAQRRVGQMFGSGLLTHQIPTEIAPEPEQTVDRDADLDVDSLAALQEIAKAEDVEIKRSKVEQREAIVAARDAKTQE